YRAVVILVFVQSVEQGVEAVAVQRTHVLEAQLLEDHALQDQHLDRIHPLPCEAEQALAHFGDAGDQLLNLVAYALVGLSLDDAVEVAGDGAHVGRDGHLVVVEDDHHLRLDVPGVVHALEANAAGEAGVADYGHHVVVASGEVARGTHAHRRRDGGAGVGDVEGVVGAFVAHREAADAAVLAQGGEAVAAAGDDLMAVGLMAHIPDDFVGGSVEGVVQRQRKLDRAEAGGQMATHLADGGDHVVAQLFGHPGQVGARNFFQIGGGVDPVQELIIHEAPASGYKNGGGGG